MLFRSYGNANAATNVCLARHVSWNYADSITNGSTNGNADAVADVRLTWNAIWKHADAAADWNANAITNVCLTIDARCTRDAWTTSISACATYTYATCNASLRPL